MLYNTISAEIIEAKINMRMFLSFIVQTIPKVNNNNDESEASKSPLNKNQVE